jgi:hypothetical protein
MSKQLIDRQEQGRIIAQMNGSVNRINDKSYIVNSQSGNGSYNVNANELANINPLFKQGKELTGKRPNTLTSDGARNFNDSFNKEFYTNTTPRTRHIRHIRLQGDHNNNKMERFNEEVRDREKTMRGLKKIDTSILPGYQIYHNYMRPHEGLNGKTPAEKCGIEIEGNDKWKTIIENASFSLRKE